MQYFNFISIDLILANVKDILLQDLLADYIEDYIDGTVTELSHCDLLRKTIQIFAI